MLLLPLLLACATEPSAPAAPTDPVVAELGQTMQQGGAQTPWTQAGQGAAMPATTPAAMTPRQQADELFNTAMRAHETGDAATATQALPQALAAYAQVTDLDLDGLFHVAVLQLAMGHADDAIVTADQVLAQYPTHLLALGVGARAADRAGKPDVAAAYRQRYVAAYGAESAAAQLYGHHQVLLPVYLEEAQPTGG